MIHFFSWYLTLTLLGLLSFPLVYSLFPKLADRGYSLSRAAGMLVWSYAFWILTSLGISENNLGGILLGLAVLIGLSLWAASRAFSDFRSIFEWFKKNSRLIITVESLFFLSFAALALFRAANPEALGTEKPMELAFINAILRSPTFPPRDPWLSGYAISYYHFGYIMTAMLAKLTATAGSIAFNLMIALIFALSAVGAYGILYNLQALDNEVRNSKSKIQNSALLAPLFLLLVSNFEALLEMLHQNGIFWRANAPNFWTWLNIKTLNEDPATLVPVPERFWWWWRASRVVQDFDLAGNFREVIDEFPAFSFILGDLHPHVLSLPFILLAVAIALHIYLGGWRGESKIFGFRFTLSPLGIFIVALILGGLAFLNTWDILIAAALIASAYTLKRVNEDNWGWQRIEDFLYFGMLTGIAAILLYLPFYLGFSSQAGGILPNLINPTRGAHLWIMFGTLLLPIFFWMITLWRGEINWKRGFGLVLGLLFALWLLSWLIAWVASIANSALAMTLIQSQGLTRFGELFSRANARRGAYLGGTLTLLLVAGGAVSLLFFRKTPINIGQDERRAPLATSFILLLTLLGSLLVIAPEFFYLRDQFSTRMNTIFKFYYQAWLLWSLAAAYGISILLKKKSGIVLFALILTSLIYPIYGVMSKARANTLTLDSAAYLQEDEAAAIEWLKNAPDGIILESVGGSYTGYARIATNTGLPTVLGWPGHESQWRGGYEEMGSRQGDIDMIYSTPDWETAEALLTQYDVRYVVIGLLEESTYLVKEEKIDRHLELVFSQGSVRIYRFP